MNLSHPNRALGVRTTASCGDKQALMQREIESAVEAERECGQVPSGILSEVECMIAATQAGLEVTENGVDPLELGQVFRLSPRDDGGLMHTAGRGDRAKTGQPGCARSILIGYREKATVIEPNKPLAKKGDF